MRTFNPTSLKAYLEAFDVSKNLIEEAISGFDFKYPVYERHFWTGDRLYQLIRLGSSSRPFGYRGNWYGLAGITTSGVAVMDGLSGRRLHEFQVVRDFPAVEGIAVGLPETWKDEVGGPGGGTQIFVPPVLAGRISPVGPADRW